MCRIRWQPRIDKCPTVVAVCFWSPAHASFCTCQALFDSEIEMCFKISIYLFKTKQKQKFWANCELKSSRFKMHKFNDLTLPNQKVFVRIKQLHTVQLPYDGRSRISLDGARNLCQRSAERCVSVFGERFYIRFNWNKIK